LSSKILQEKICCSNSVKANFEWFSNSLSKYPPQIILQFIFLIKKLCVNFILIRIQNHIVFYRFRKLFMIIVKNLDSLKSTKSLIKKVRLAFFIRTLISLSSDKHWAFPYQTQSIQNWKQRHNENSFLTEFIIFSLSTWDFLIYKEHLIIHLFKIMAL